MKGPSNMSLGGKSGGYAQSAMANFHNTEDEMIPMSAQNQNETPFMGNHVVKTVRNLKRMSSNGQRPPDEQPRYQSGNQRNRQDGMPMTNGAFNPAQRPPQSQMNTSKASMAQPQLQQQFSAVSSSTNKYELKQEETFEQRLARIKQKQKIGGRPPSGDPRLRKQTANQYGKFKEEFNANIQSRQAQMRPNGLNQSQSKTAIRTVANHGNDENVGASVEFSQNGSEPNTANRLLGNRQAFMPNPNAVNQIVEGKPHDTMQTYTTQANSEFAQNVDVENPNADLQLTEHELQELYSRPYMNPQHFQVGNLPGSNEILQAEQLLVESKQEKCVELIKQSTEVHEMLENIRDDDDINTVTNGQGIDLNGIIKLLFSDAHFMNLLGNLLTKKPATKKVEDFMAQQIQDRIEAMRTDAKIQKSFQKLNDSIQDRLKRLADMQKQGPF